jgi:hypothetical protein
VYARDLSNEEPLSPEQIAEAQAAGEARYERSLAAASNLIAERVSGRFAILYDVEEGTSFPDGTVDVSGCALDERGDLYAFWVDWDAAAGRAVLGIWRQEEITARDHVSAEFRHARALVGLGVNSTGSRD